MRREEIAAPEKSLEISVFLALSRGFRACI